MREKVIDPRSRRALASATPGSAELEAALRDLTAHHQQTEIAAWLGVTPQAIQVREAHALAGRPWLDAITAAELLTIAHHNGVVAAALREALARGEEALAVPMDTTRATQDLLCLVAEACACIAPIACATQPAAHPLLLDLMERIAAATNNLRHAIARSRA